MKWTSKSTAFRLAVGGILCMLLWLVLMPAQQRPLTVDFRIAGRPQVSNGVMLISFVLSNGTARPLNVVDDIRGNPFLVLDAGTGGDPPGSGNLGLGLGFMANSLKLNLAPGATLTNNVQLTNPPPRFRLLVEVRDLAAERRRGVVQLFEFLAIKANLRKPTGHADKLITLPASPWMQNDGSISTTPQQ